MFRTILSLIAILLAGCTAPSSVNLVQDRSGKILIQDSKTHYLRASELDEYRCPGTLTLSCNSSDGIMALCQCATGR